MRSQQPIRETEENEENKDERGGFPANKSFKSGMQYDENLTERNLRHQNLALSLKGNEEVVVPALNMKKPIDFNTVDD